MYRNFENVFKNQNLAIHFFALLIERRKQRALRQGSSLPPLLNIQFDGGSENFTKLRSPRY
jgi:hypothetical protein